MLPAPLLYLPPSLRSFALRRTLPSPSSRYAAVEYDLVSAVRPELVVNVGASDGVSFFAACQAMDDHGVDGIAYAFDRWDVTEGVHPLATFDAVNAHARRHHPGVAYVVRMAPWEAHRHFDEGTIDVLRVDGSRPEVMPGADVEVWYRRVRPGGLILWQGAHAAPALFSLITSRAPAFTFHDGESSLGVARKPGGVRTGDDTLLRLLFDEQRGPELEPFYAHVHEHRALDELRAATEKASPP